MVNSDGIRMGAVAGITYKGGGLTQARFFILAAAENGNVLSSEKI